MDGSRFDDFTRALAGRSTRRRLIASGVSTLLAAIGLDRFAGDAGAAKFDCYKDLGKRCGRRRDGPCRGECVSCLNGICTEDFCQDRPCTTRLSDGDPSRRNACKVCSTGATRRRDTRLDNMPDGTGCPPPDDSGGPCAGFGASCQDGQCVRDHLEDGTPCGEPGECQTGICQGGECVFVSGPDGVACTAIDRCNAGVCTGGVCEQVPVDDGTLCGVSGEICCQGTCCAAGNVCGRRGCEPPPPPPVADCVIDGAGYARDDKNPQNECEICNPDESTTEWTPSEGFCNVEAVCCGGICCDFGYWCVNEACTNQVAQCSINGGLYDDGTLNPVNPCQYCDATGNPSQWSSYPDGQGGQCPGNGQCCSSVCCGAGEVCQVGACTANPVTQCTIAGVAYQHLQRNPANECEQCDPFSNPNGWSLVPGGTSCGTTAGRVCCSGSCCAPNAGCNSNGFCA